jgi:hypothetical protein
MPFLVKLPLVRADKKELPVGKRKQVAMRQLTLPHEVQIHGSVPRQAGVSFSGSVPFPDQQEIIFRISKALIKTGNMWHEPLSWFNRQKQGQCHVV